MISVYFHLALNRNGEIEPFMAQSIGSDYFAMCGKLANACLAKPEPASL